MESVALLFLLKDKGATSIATAVFYVCESILSSVPGQSICGQLISVTYQSSSLFQA